MCSDFESFCIARLGFGVLQPRKDVWREATVRLMSLTQTAQSYRHIWKLYVAFSKHDVTTSQMAGTNTTHQDW